MLSFSSATISLTIWMSGRSPMRIRLTPRFASSRQYPSFLLTSAMMAQLPYPYLSRNCSFVSSLFYFRCLRIALTPCEASLIEAMTPTIMQKLTNPLLYLLVSMEMSGSLPSTFDHSFSVDDAIWFYIIVAAPMDYLFCEMI